MRYALNNPRNSLVFIDCLLYDMDVKMCTFCTNKDIYIIIDFIQFLVNYLIYIIRLYCIYTAG